MESINFWPILVASVVAFVIGALWYSPVLFGKTWMRLRNITDKDITEDSKKGMWKLYVIQFVTTVVMFCVMGFLIIVSTGSANTGDGLFVAFLVWLGFSATTAVGGMLWNKAPLKLVLLEQGYALLVYLVGGAIIGAWN